MVDSIDWSWLEEKWQKRWNRKLTIQAALFIIALQEFPQLCAEVDLSNPVNKQDILHVASCFLLSDFYVLIQETPGSWPTVQKKNNDFDALPENEQDKLLHARIPAYFARIWR